jgi:hypothetical protein
MKTRHLTIVFIGFMLCTSCQQNDNFMIEPTDKDACQDAFENANNKLATAPFLTTADWIALPKNDNDFWKMTLKPNEKGALPTKIRYTLLNPSHINIIVYHADTVLLSPRVTMTFRDSLGDFVQLPPLKSNETVVVQMRQASEKATCYQLKFE